VPFPLPPHLRALDRITIELREIGPDDGRRVGADAYSLTAGCVRAVPVGDAAVPWWSGVPETYAFTRWEWDGSTTDDGAYRFHRP
jgi:hypothetical protein